jgi:hypothetical protein
MMFFVDNVDNFKLVTNYHQLTHRIKLVDNLFALDNKQIVFKSEKSRDSSPGIFFIKERKYRLT